MEPWSRSGAGEVVGYLRVEERSFGSARPDDGRTRLAGSPAIEWARAHGLHKLTLTVFPDNEAAIALHRKFRFVEEGRRTKHMRRANGELWDLIEMGLLL
jgi:L-amino acid N-acyltransferase YncA